MKRIKPGVKCVVIQGCNSGKTCIAIRPLGPVAFGRKRKQYDAWEIQPCEAFIRPDVGDVSTENGRMPTFALLPLDDPDNTSIMNTLAHLEA